MNQQAKEATTRNEREPEKRTRELMEKKGSDYL
jgi:hypothetical protein